MPVRRDTDGRWRYRTVVRKPDGSTERISGTAPKHANTKPAAEQAERDAIDRLLHPERAPKPRKEVPTFHEWFNGRFWKEWVIARRNKPSEVNNKEGIYRCHLRPVFAELPLDEITDGTIAAFRAQLVEKKLCEKRINNILGVLSKPLHYAQRCKLIDAVPEIGIRRVEPSEIVPWDFGEYARIVEAARRYECSGIIPGGPRIHERDHYVPGVWHVAVLLAGEAGLRSGEIKALQWEHVDLMAGTITIATQTCLGITTTPKGRTRRTVPITEPLLAALKAWPVLPREGYVCRTVDGRQLTAGQMACHIRAILTRAGSGFLRKGRSWHSLRHTFATDAARFGVSPWVLQAWLGHKTMDETMRYVHVATTHGRKIPEPILAAGTGVGEPTDRVVAMLGARAKTVAKPALHLTELPMIPAT